MSRFNLDHMTWEDVDKLDRDKTIFFLPFSPIEEHGPHLPLGTDFYGARDAAELAIQMVNEEEPSLNYILIPCIPLGCTESTMDFPGTISVRGKTLVRIIYDVCSSLARHGFKYVIISNHHLDMVHVKAISVAINKVMSKYDITVYEPGSALVYSGKFQEETTGGEPDAGAHTEIHADIKETSYIKYKYPELLKDCYKDLPPCYVDIRKSFKEGNKGFKQMGAEKGYIGTPAEATLKRGKVQLEQWSSFLANSALRLYKGEQLPQINQRMRSVFKYHVKLD